MRYLQLILIITCAALLAACGSGSSSASGASASAATSAATSAKARTVANDRETAVAASPDASAGSKPAKQEWLPLCGKCISPTVYSTSGIGTANAVAKAHVTFEDARDHCKQWSFNPKTDCDMQAKQTVKQQRQKNKIYTATADCVHGKITLATGDHLTYAGIWRSGPLKGKTRWRFVSTGYDNGKYANENGPVNGSMVDTTSKILCPDGVGANRRR